MAEEKKYSEKDVERLIEETTRHGAVHATLYFDAHGTDEASVRNTLVEFVARLTSEKGVLYCKGEVLEPYKRALSERTEQGEGYSTSAQVNILCENFVTLHGLCLRYAPVGAEILNPKRLSLGIAEAQAVLLDASQQSQEYTAYILKRVLKGEEYKRFEEQLKMRAELGKELVDKSKPE